MSIVNNIPSIRPREIFKLVENTFPDRNIEMVMNIPPSGIGSLFSLESALLVALMKVINPQAVFEFGTYNGNGTLLFARNSHDDTVITTLDLPPEDIDGGDLSGLNLRDADENDEFLRREFKEKGAYYIDRADPDVKAKIRQLYCNSLDFNPTKHGLESSQDIVFIDGGHDYNTIQNDTRKALVMARPNAIIVWHDYKSTIHTEVETYLRDLADELPIFGIGSTMLAVSFLGDYASFLDNSQDIL